MSRWYKHAAVFTAWLGLSVAVQAQQYVPLPVGAARMPEPLRYQPKPQPELVPGPVTPLVAPPGPPECLNLPASHSSAFQCEDFPPENAFFFHYGGMALQRYRLSHLPIVFYDNQNVLPSTNVNTLGLGDGTSQATFMVGVDNGREPFRAGLLYDLANTHPDMRGGVRATFGYLLGGCSVEVSGFYIWPGSDAETIYSQGQISLPYNSRSNNTVPGVFEAQPDNRVFGVLGGAAGLWRQADVARITYLNTIGGAEINFRTWNVGISHVELILGARYLFARERINIFTDDQFFAVPPDRSPEEFQATHVTDVRNNFMGLQAGGEYSFPCTLPYCGWVWFTGVGKAAVGPNLITRRLQVTRGDGVEALYTRRTGVRVSQVYDIAGFVDLHMWERVRIRMGYQAMWLVGFSAAATQVEFNLNNLGHRAHDYGSQFWHGPIAELHFLF